MMRDITPQFFGMLALVAGVVMAHGLWVQLFGAVEPASLASWAQVWLVAL